MRIVYKDALVTCSFQQLIMVCEGIGSQVVSGDGIANIRLAYPIWHNLGGITRLNIKRNKGLQYES